MTNAEKFKCVFGLYATELWAMGENDMLKWLNAECKEPERKTARWIHIGFGCFECGECGERVTLNAYTAEKASDRFRFCYHCGARMEEGEADGKEET